MSNFVKVRTCSFDFDGDRISARLMPLEYVDMMKLQSNMGSRDRVVEFVAISRELVPKYALELTGLRDAEGNALVLDDVLSQVYFAELLRDIVTELIEISQPKVVSDPT